MNMTAYKMYQLGQKLGLTTDEIDNIIENQIAPYITVIEYVATNPCDLYKTIGKYGTISLNDFQ